MSTWKAAHSCRSRSSRPTTRSRSSRARFHHHHHHTTTTQYPQKEVMRRAKIVATLGPATSSYENIRAIIDAGVDVARMNLSHGTYAVHEEVYANVRKAAA